MTYSTDLAQLMSSNTQSSFRIKCERMNMTSGSHYDFLNFLGGDKKKCNMYRNVRFCRDEPQTWSTECFACEVYTGGMVQCCKFGRKYC